MSPQGTLPATSTVPALREIVSTTTETRISKPAAITASPSFSFTPTLVALTLVAELPTTNGETATAKQSPTLESTKLPTFTSLPTATPHPTQAPLPTATAVPISVNGVPQESFIIIPNDAREHVRVIFAQGQSMGRNPNAFSKLGDSVTLTDHYLTRFDFGQYTFGLI